MMNSLSYRVGKILFFMGPARLSEKCSCHPEIVQLVTSPSEEPVCHL